MGTYSEEKAWVEVDPKTGHLNQGSYAAIAVWGLVELAVDVLYKEDQRISPSAVRSMSEVFAKITSDVQKMLRPDESIDLNAGSHTRVRGALRTALATLPPPPFGETDAQWAAWVERVTTRVIGIARVANDLWHNGHSEDRPWSAFTTTAVA